MTLTEVGCFTWYQSIGLPDKIKSFENLFSKRKFKEAFLKEKYYFILKRQSPPQSHRYYLLPFVLNLSFLFQHVWRPYSPATDAFTPPPPLREPANGRIAEQEDE